jgi:hypothetical protein
MEAVAYGNETTRFDDSLVQGQSYDFWSVRFLPTSEDDMRYISRLRFDFYVYLSAHTVVTAPSRIIEIIGIAQFPPTFMKFRDVYTMDEFFLAGMSNTPKFKKHICNYSCSYSTNTYCLCL